MTQSYKTELAAFRRFLADDGGDQAVFATTGTDATSETSSSPATSSSSSSPASTNATRRVRSVFFGGGTPSLAKVRHTASTSMHAIVPCSTERACNC
jgi:hypothetical protein